MSIKVHDIANGMRYDSDRRDQERPKVYSSIPGEGHEHQEKDLNAVVDGETIEKGGSDLLAGTVGTVRS